MKKEDGHYVMATYKEPQDVGGQMLFFEVFYFKTNVENIAIKYAEDLKTLPYVESVSIAKALYKTE